MNDDTTLTEFSGISGRVLQRSVSLGSLITGIVLGLALIIGSFVLALAKAPNAALLFGQVVMALALARFALNGRYGEWGGTLFSGTGGSWGEVASVAGRYLALTAIWLVPMFLFGLRQLSAVNPMMAMMDPKVIWLLTLYMLAMTLMPPLFLVIAVSADGFSEIFSPEHWRRQFEGRLGDLFAVYVVYTGTLGMVVVLSIPLVLLAMGGSPKLGGLLAGLTACFVFGIAVNLLGRLCGFFACGELGLSRPPAPIERPAAPAPEVVVAPEEPAGASPEPPVSVPISVAAAPAFPASVPPARIAAPSPAPVAGPLPSAPVQLSAAALDVAPVVPADGEKRRPLLDAQQRVDAALKRFAVDPESVIAALQDLHGSFAAHPLVLHSLSICLHRSGHVEPAIEAANQALPLCFERGHSFLAAELFRELRSRLDRLDLDREKLLLIAQTLDKKNDLATAAKAYSAVIAIDAGETRAIKGLLQVADRILQETPRPDAAARVYRYLLDRCGDSPLADFMRLGFDQAQKKIDASAANPDFA